MKTSGYLLDTAKEHIEGRISIDEAQKCIQRYYVQRADSIEIEKDTKDADIVSSRIAKLLGEKAFQFSLAEWLTIHRRLFEGVFTHAGQIRQYNITKKEWVLKGDTVIYATWNSIKDTLDYDFGTETRFSYEGLSVEALVKHLAKFASDIWQIHPFCDADVIIRTRLEKPSKINGFALLSLIFYPLWGGEDGAVHINTYDTESQMGLCA